MKMLLLSFALLTTLPLAAAQTGTHIQTGVTATTPVSDIALDARTRTRLTLALKAGRTVSFLNAQGGRVAHAVLNTQGLAQVLPDGPTPFASATNVTITGGCAAQRYALVPSASANAVLTVQTGGRTSTLASVLSAACNPVTGTSQVRPNLQTNTSTSTPSSAMTGATSPAPGQGGTGSTGMSGSVTSGGVPMDATTTMSLTTALKAGLGVALLDASGQVVARATLNAQGQAQVVKIRPGTAVQVSITTPQRTQAQNYTLVRTTGTSVLVSVQGTSAGGVKAAAAVTLASVLNAGTSTVAPPRPPALQLDTSTTLGLTTALKAGRMVVFLGAQGQVVAHAKLDAQGRAQVVMDGPARLSAAARVTISDTRNNAAQSYALVPSTSTHLLVMAAAGKAGNATNVSVSLASVLNAPLAAPRKTGVVNAVTVTGQVAPATAGRQQGTGPLDAVTGVRLTAALKAGRTVVFLGAQGQVVAHAKLDAQGRAQIIPEGTARLEAAVRVTISDTRSNAEQRYTLVPGSSASRLLVVATAGKGSSTGNVSLASVLNAPLASPRPASTASTSGTAPASSVSVGAAVQTPVQGAGSNAPAAPPSTSASHAGGSVSAGAAVQTPDSRDSIGASGTVSPPASTSGSVGVGASVGTSSSAAPSAPAVGVSVGVSGGGSISAPTPAPVPSPAPTPVSTPTPPPVSLPLPVPVPGVGGNSGGIGVGVGVGIGGH